MEVTALVSEQGKTKLYVWASALALVTIFYNLAEGVISILFGLEDGTIALSGFGLDSFIEVISGMGIWHMIKRMKLNSKTSHDRFEQQALRITGTAFFVLTLGLLITAALSLYKGHKPETTLWGIVISVVSILSMWLLIHYKIKVGRELGSNAILADADCTKVCIYLSVVLLLSSVGYELTGIGGFDSIGAILIAGLSFREGRESFQKAKGISACSCSH